MLRLIRTTSSLRLLVAVAILALAGVIVAAALRPDGDARARDADTDVDGDGRADCWTLEPADEARYAPAKLAVWPGCRGEPITIEWRADMTVLMIPPELASADWLRWIAERIVGREAVRCVGLVGCPPPGPSWQWVLDSAWRFAAEPGHHGTVAARWSSRPREAGGALVLPAVSAGWMQRLRGAMEREPAASLAGARIIVDLARGPTLPAIACGGMRVHAEAGGIVGTDARGRWTWLFRGLADYGGYRAGRLACREGLVIATTGGTFADVVAIEPVTGGWLLERGNDCCPGAYVALAGDELLWARDDGTVIPVQQLRTWLAGPPARRARLGDLARAYRPELAHDGAMSAGMIGRDHPSAELWGEPFAPATVDAATRGTLRASLTCGGRRITWSRTAVLAERAGLARWLVMERRGSTRRIASVRCTGRDVTIELVTSGDLLDESAPRFGREALVVDLDRNRWRIRATE